MAGESAHLDRPVASDLYELSSGEDAALIEDLDALRELGATVQPVRYDGAVAYVILGYDAVERAFRGNADLPGNSFFKLFTQEFYGTVGSTTAGEEHRFQRHQLLAGFKPSAIRARLEDILEPVANALIDTLPAGEPFDFIEAYATPNTFDVISSMLGVPIADWPRFRGNIFQFLGIRDPAASLAARELITDYLRPLIAERRVRPGADLISQLIAAETDGRRFSEEELLDEVRFLYPAAIHNTANALGLCLHAVLADPDVRLRVATDKKARLAAVEETLRLMPPLPVVVRYTEAPIVFDGVAIAADSFVMLAISSANRDPLRYPEPTRFSLDRSVTDHFSFGRGAYLCIGLHLARAEMQVMLELALKRLAGLRLVNDPGNTASGFFHGFRRLVVQFDSRVPAA